MKNEILKRAQNKEDRMLLSNVLDKLEKHQKTGVSMYTNFLDVRTKKVVEDTLKFMKIPYNVYVPNEECEKFIIVFGEYTDFVVTYKIDGKFKHNEVLGAIFSLGIDNDQIGDIFIEEDCVYITILRRLKNLFESSLTMISNKKIVLDEVEEMILKKERFENITIIVPSLRLDCLVAKLANMGRNDSTKYIKDGLVLVNYQEIKDNKKINIKDVISIRKVGKFIIESEEMRTKKDNIILSIKKYN